MHYRVGLYQNKQNALGEPQITHLQNTLCIINANGWSTKPRFQSCSYFKKKEKLDKMKKKLHIFPFVILIGIIYRIYRILIMIGIII